MRKSFADMARSLGLMAVIVAVVLVIGGRYLIAPGKGAQMPAADYSSVVQQFPREAGSPVLAPHSIPSSWRANAARLSAPAPRAVQMHIGWALPADRYAGLDEATGDPVSLLRAVLGAAGLEARGSTRIGSDRWNVRRAANGEEALTRTDGKLTVVVTGNATDAELRMLAGSLS